MKPAINKYTSASIILFLAGSFFLAGRDNIVHGIHYDYGLIFDEAWANLDWTIYFIQFQILALSCALVARSWKLYVFFEAFTLSATQDLMFYAWRGFVFPAGDWTWMPLYDILGFYTTSFQIVLSALSIILALAIVKGVQKIGESHGYMAHKR